MGKRASREIVEDQIEQIARDLAKINPIRAILYGSYARGDYHEASDFDLLVIKETDLPFLKRGLEVLEAVETKVHVEPLVYTPQEIDEMIKLGNPLILDALSEGRVIYERK
jgi:hypothetical protein